MKFKSSYFLVIPQIVWILVCIIFVIFCPEVLTNEDKIVPSILVLFGGCAALYILSFPFFWEDVSNKETK